MSEPHPELDGYVPHDQRPLRRRRTLWLIRLGVVLAIGGFVLPGVVTIVGGNGNNAQRACAQTVGQQGIQASQAEARFEFFGPGFIGWECYAVSLRGIDHFVASLGLIPVAPAVSPTPELDRPQPA